MRPFIVKEQAGLGGPLFGEVVRRFINPEVVPLVIQPGTAGRTEILRRGFGSGFGG